MSGPGARARSRSVGLCVAARQSSPVGPPGSRRLAALSVSGSGEERSAVSG